MSSAESQRSSLSDSPLKRFWSDNALSIVVLGLFLVFWVAQSLSGWETYNAEQQTHGQQTVTYLRYLGSSDFWSATAENWESEFLQMGLYVALTIYLKQRGSAESNPYPDERPATTPDEAPKVTPGSSWPVRKGGLALVLYRNSLTLVLLTLFLASFVLHLTSSHVTFNQEQLEHGEQTVTLLQFLGHAEFWFQSFQNWQSEFLAIASMVVLSIYFRQVGSSQSKAVEAPNRQTSDD